MSAIPLDASANSSDRKKAIKSWSESPKDDGMKLNADFSPFDRKTETGGIESEYATRQPRTPAKPADPYTSN